MFRINKIGKFLFVVLLFTALVPYLGYGVSQIKNGYVLIGSYAQSMEMASIYTGRLGKYFTYIKDLVCVLLICNLIWYKRRQASIIIIYAMMILGYGAFALALSGRFSMLYIIAGVRAAMFTFVTMLYCLYTYDNVNKKDILLYSKICDLTLVIQIAIVIMQISRSSGWSRLGSGAYRYCGCFAGSGNLGCYAVGLMLFYSLISELEQNINRNSYIIRAILVVFLSIASGTRTAIIVTAIIAFYMIIYRMMKTRNFDYKSIAFTFGALVAILIVPAINSLSQWIGRGKLMNSGGGRIELFFHSLNSSNVVEFVIGRGIGVGTNAAISMGARDAVSDSTLNLIFTQFGVIGILFFLIAVYIMLKRLYAYSLADKGFKHLFVFVIAVMFLVGNIFEHIAMTILIVLTYYMAFYVDKFNGNG